VNILRDKHLTVVGAGNIGRILLERLLAAGVAASQLAVCDSDPERGRVAAARAAKEKMDQAQSKLLEAGTAR
jgi:pyrroline-5-carboxylate reductase